MQYTAQDKTVYKTVQCTIGHSLRNMLCSAYRALYSADISGAGCKAHEVTIQGRFLSRAVIQLVLAVNKINCSYVPLVPASCNPDLEFVTNAQTLST